MSNFISNDRVAFDIEKIIVVHWNCADEDKTTRVDIEFINDTILHLHYELDEDYELINDLRDLFGYDPLPRM